MAGRLPEGRGMALAGTSGRVWTRRTVSRTGAERTVMARGQHDGEALDDLPEHYLRWILDKADLRPGPAEELELREACGETGSGAGSRSGTAEWSTVAVGHWCFQAPPEVTRLFDQEMSRLRQIFDTDQAAFEAMVANSMTTPLESIL